MLLMSNVFQFINSPLSGLLFCLTSSFFHYDWVLQIWCESIYSTEGTPYTRSCLHQFFHGCKINFFFITSCKWLIVCFYPWSLDISLTTFSLADYKYGRESPIIQNWWSILVSGSHNSWCFIHFSSFGCTVILNYCGGRCLLSLIIYVNFSTFLTCCLKWSWRGWEITMMSLTQVLIEHYHYCFPLFQVEWVMCLTLIEIRLLLLDLKIGSWLICLKCINFASMSIN